MDGMTDLEILQKCAAAMAIKYALSKSSASILVFVNDHNWYFYDPLRDDEQAMALLKKFELRVDRTRGMPPKWAVYSSSKFQDMSVNEDLNRAICLWVARQ